MFHYPKIAIWNFHSRRKQLLQQEKQRAEQLETKLKTVAQILYQWKKINYYQQLEQEQEAQIEQLLKPPNFKK